jgi:cytochrome c oxidase subunit 2
MRQKLAFAVSIALVGCIILATRFYEVDLPVWRFLGGGHGLDPASLHLTGEFVESNLGTAREPDGSFTVRMLAEEYVFVPHCVVVPAGVLVHFRITSPDVVHLLDVSGTNVRVKAVPGAVNEVTAVFATEGKFEAPCREFCGPGHFAMRARLEVVPQDRFAGLRADERRNCESP